MRCPTCDAVTSFTGLCYSCLAVAPAPPAPKAPAARCVMCEGALGENARDCFWCALMHEGDDAPFRPVMSQAALKARYGSLPDPNRALPAFTASDAQWLATLGIALNGAPAEPTQQSCSSSENASVS